MRLMPSLGYALAPYGAEWTVRTAFQQEQRAKSRDLRITNAALRVGNTGSSSTWGVTVRAADVVRMRGLPVGLAADVWRQPELLADQTSDEQHVGGGALATVVLPVPRLLRSRWSDGVHVAAGYKSQGFVPGEPLAGGLVFRAGITMSAR